MGRITITFVIMISLVYLTDLAICMDEKGDKNHGMDRSASEIGIIYSISDEDVDMKASRGAGDNETIVFFLETSYIGFESTGIAPITLGRKGNTDVPCTVHLKAISGTAFSLLDFKPFSFDVTFSEDEEFISIIIEIIDDVYYEPDEVFVVKMTAKIMEDGSHEHVTLGKVSTCEVTIISDDEPGQLEFALEPSFLEDESFYARIPVSGVNGRGGHVNVKRVDIDITAKKGKEGTLLIDNQENRPLSMHHVSLATSEFGNQTGFGITGTIQIIVNN